MIRRILLLPHIKVHNANALSSPFTIGFPAMTAWLGAVHVFILLSARVTPWIKMAQDRHLSRKPVAIWMFLY